MSGPLKHSPADVVDEMIIGLGAGTDPDTTAADKDWPVFAYGAPDAANDGGDDTISVTNTTGFLVGDTMNDGRAVEHHGVQLAVRAGDPARAWEKANVLYVLLTEGVYDRAVRVDGSAYVVRSISPTSNLIDAGTSPASNRRLITYNALVTVRQTS
jgi:hypothetical protein